LKILIRFIIITAFSLQGHCQADGTKIIPKPIDNPGISPVDSSKQRDLADEIYKLLGKNELLKKTAHPKRTNVSVVPAIGYSLSSGFAVNLVNNLAFYTTQDHQENLSEILTSLAFDTKKQKYINSQAEILARDNSFKFVTDIRGAEYPINTYGLGSNTTTATEDPIYYNYTRFYGTLYKKIIHDFFAGAGYNLDYYFHVSEMGNQDGSEPDFNKYGFSTQSTSSGLNVDLLYDSRRNPINPLTGSYASLTFRQNFTFLGSNSAWNSLLLDMRKYIKLSPSSNNVLALWGMAWLSSANTPYLALPSTGLDMYNNTGRGYAQGRFRGRDMLYLESEYRFGISRNGLIGGVVFINGETFSGYPNNRFQRVAPAAGPGIRIKANKHSDSNICIDYGFGIDHSHGFFVNLGEVF
jgi:outer membrane protein assembly factor BamA